MINVQYKGLHKNKQAISYKWWTIITWVLAFAVPSVIGMIIIYILEMFRIAQEYVFISAWTVMAAGTFGFLYLISKYTRVGISNAIYRPIGTIKTVYVLILGLIVIIPFSYISYDFSFPLFLVSSFIESHSLLALPFEIIYYFSEIVVVTYIYIMATKGWVWKKGPLTSGTIAVILGWAVLHAITKNILTAIIGIVIAVIFYFSYESSKSPIVPIILWFAFLLG